VASTAVYPVRVDATFDPRLSRWMWLAKWLLLIPHYVVLALLWIAFSMLSVVAFFAILFTGKYPRAIFTFNVGVLRWTWRVEYYAYGALATDRYPPFTLKETPDYPAHLEITYPERLSRGLVLVKWWLLAIPHYFVVALFASGTWAAWRLHGGSNLWSGTGLIGVLVLIAAVTLAFTGRYPRNIYDLVLGLNRWVLRVVAYAALMTDQYPPFRLDLGGRDPASTLTVTPAPVPAEPVGRESAEHTEPTEPTPTEPEPASGHATALARPSAGGWNALRVVSVVAGALVVLASLLTFAGGGFMLWADQTQREGGYVTSPDFTLTSNAYAITSDRIKIDGASFRRGPASDLLDKVRVRVTAADAAKPVFVGIAPTDFAARYLAGVGYTTVNHLAGSGANYTAHPGHAPLSAPERAGIWTASASGSGTQTIVWPVTGGSWTVVVANPDGSAGLDVRADAGAAIPDLTWIAIGFLGGGTVLVTLGVLMIAVPARRASR
jgi:hypothetical protein